MKQTLKKLSAFMMAMAISGALFAQVPQKFNYQGIARDTKGNPMAQQRMTLKLTVLPTSDATEGEYEEIQSVTTNEFGLYNLQIGNGTPVKGEMKTVKWETGNKYIKVAIDPKGGNDFVDAGTTQLLSVPYAIYADKAGMAKTTAASDRAGTVSTSAAGTGTVNFLTKFTAANTIYNSQLFDNGTNIGLGTTTPTAKFQITQNTASVLELIRMQNLSATGAGRFTLYSDAASNYSTFTKYGSTYAGSYAGLTGLYPYGNLLAFGNNGLAAGDGLGRFLISTAGNAGISIFKGGTSKLKFHADFTTENVGIGGNAAPVSRVHLNNTDGTGMDLRLTNTTTGHTATDGMVIGMNGNDGSITNRENANLTLGTNNTTRMTVTAAGNVELANQIKIAGGAPGAGKVLTSDAAGLASWTTPSITSVGGTTNYIAKYTPNGTTLGNSQLFDNGTNIGIGTMTPTSRLNIETIADSGIVSNTNIERDSASGNIFITNSNAVGNMTFGAVGQVGGSDFGAGIFGRGFGFTYTPFTLRDIGVYGSANFSNTAIGILGSSNNGTAVMGLATTGIAGFFKAPSGTAILADSGNVIVNTGKLGIGTTAPNNQVEIKQNTSISSGSMLHLNDSVGFISWPASAQQTDVIDGVGLLINKTGFNEGVRIDKNYTGSGVETMIITGNMSSGTPTLRVTADTNLVAAQLQGKLNLIDGTQGDGKILVSDAGGQASWSSNAPGTIGFMGSTSSLSNTPTGTTGFITGTRVAVTITSTTQTVHVTTTVALGAGVSAANALNLYVGYNTTNAATPVTTLGAGSFGLTCPASTRSHYTLSYTVTGLTPGTYYFGMVGNSSSPNWTNNEFGYTSVFVKN